MTGIGTPKVSSFKSQLRCDGRSELGSSGGML